MAGKLKNYAIIALMALSLVLVAIVALRQKELAQARAEAARLERNQESLLRDVEFERNRAGELQATVGALTLRRDELEGLLPVYARKVQEMEIRLKEVQSVASVTVETAADVKAKPDTVYISVPEKDPDTDGPRRLVYSDAWLDVVIDMDAVGDAAVRVQARDSLTVVAHRERSRCLFRKKGKIVRYTAVPASPYTTVTGLTYVEVTE